MPYFRPLKLSYDIRHITRSSHVRATSTWAPEHLKILQYPAPHFGHIRLLLLNRPEARNALSRQLVADLRNQVNDVHSQNGVGPTRVLIIASNIDQAFCSGADLKERKSFTREGTMLFLNQLRQAFTDLSNLTVPTITAISSFALGGGMELGLCSTFRIFGSSAVVGQPETRLAIIPGAGGTYRLPALIGLSRARDMILTGRQVNGTEAYSMGLCDRLVAVGPEERQKEGVARGMVMIAALDLANSLCEGGPVAIAQAMKALNGSQRGEEAENEAYQIVLDSEDRNEALRAFAEKRKPIFKGK